MFFILKEVEMHKDELKSLEMNNAKLEAEIRLETYPTWPLACSGDNVLKSELDISCNFILLTEFHVFAIPTGNF